MKAFSIHLSSKLSPGSGPYIIWDDTEAGIYSEGMGKKIR